VCLSWLYSLRPYCTKERQTFEDGESSNLHKGFKCLDVSTGRIYISRDVVFDEDIFPFLKLHPNAGARLRSEVQLLPSHLAPPANSGYEYVVDPPANGPNVNQNPRENYVTQGIKAVADGIGTELEADPPTSSASGLLHQGNFIAETAPAHDQHVSESASSPVFESSEDMRPPPTISAPGVESCVDTMPPPVVSFDPIARGDNNNGNTPCPTQTPRRISSAPIEPTSLTSRQQISSVIVDAPRTLRSSTPLETEVVPTRPHT
jgi:hypothetical protein